MSSPPRVTTSNLRGATWISVAEALMLPTGFLTVVFLTRQLGPEGYGIFALAATLITWIEWSISSIFSRPTIKFVGESSDWKAVATVVLRTQLGFSLLAALGLVITAPWIASLLHEPVLTRLLWLFALEIPLFNLTQAHQNILTGLGQFTPRALASAIRWIARLLFIVCLVELGLSIPGAIVGSLAAMGLSLAVCRRYIHPPLWRSSNFPAKQLASYALPLFFASLAVRLYEKVDLVALKALGGTVEAAGFYAVAQNLALLGQLASPALVSVLLSTLSQLISQGNQPEAKSLIRSSLRIVLLQLPLAGLVVGSAPEIIQVLFGRQFAPAAPLFAVLILAAVAAVMVAATSAVLIASEKPQWTFVLAAPMPILALAGHWILIPRLGSLGAALVTLIVAVLGAITGVVAVHIRWQVLPPAGTLVRSCLVSLVAAWLAQTWTVPNIFLVLKLPVLGAAAVIALGLLGEFSSADLAVMRSFFGRQEKT